MKTQSSLARLWSYLKAYRFSVFFAVFLKVLSVVMSVLEPFVLGLAITELLFQLFHDQCDPVYDSGFAK